MKSPMRENIPKAKLKSPFLLKTPKGVLSHGRKKKTLSSPFEITESELKSPVTENLTKAKLESAFSVELTTNAKMPEAVNIQSATVKKFSPEHTNATKGQLSVKEPNSSSVESPPKQVLKLERGKDVYEATKLEAEETSNKVTELPEATNTTKPIIKKKSMIKKSKSVNAINRQKKFKNKNTGKKIKCTSFVKANPSKLTSLKNPEVSEVTDIPSNAENVKVHRLVVEGLPKNTSERDLNNSFNKAKSVQITKSMQGKKLLCNGFIEFTNLDDFTEALAIKNRRINGKYVQVMKEEYLAKKRPFYKRSHSPRAKRIKVDAVSNDICNDEDDSDDAENDTSVDNEEEVES